MTQAGATDLAFQANPGDLDAETRAALEWETLLSQLGSLCTSPAGKARALALRPQPTLELARERNQIVGEVLALDALGIAVPARAFPNAAEVLGRVSKGGIASAAELWQIREVLGLAGVLRVFARGQRDAYPSLSAALDSPAELAKLEQDLLHALEPDGSVADRASPELARARQRERELRFELKRRLGALLERYADVVQNDYYTEREGRYVLPVRSDAHLRVAGIVLGSSSSGATLFVEPEELTALGNQLRIQEAEALREAAKVLALLSGYVACDAEAIGTAQQACEEADLLGALSRFARRSQAIVVPLSSAARLELCAARHPLLALAGGEVISNDMTVGAGRALVISGPNAGGKTVALKTLGLVSWMARAGIPLPVAPESQVGWFDHVLADIGDEQSIARSLSTFSAHVQRLCHVLTRATPSTLILLDELASGTDPEEGAALAAAMLEALTACGAAVAVTTHYEKLKEAAAHAAHLQNASVSYDFERMAPTFRLTMGVPGASSALTVAQRHGLPSSVVARAQALLPEQSRERERAVQQLEREGQALEQQRAQLQRELAELASLRESLVTEQAAERSALAQELARDTSSLRSTVAKVRGELHSVRERLRADVADPKALRAIERDLSHAAGHVALGASLLPTSVSMPAALESVGSGSARFQKGATVRIKSSGLLASVLEIDRDRLRVLVGSIKLTLRAQEVEPAKASTKPPRPSYARPEARLAQPLGAAVRTHDNTLDVRGERVEEGLEKLDVFLDGLARAGEPLGFVLHGHGTGALKSAVRSHLQASSYTRESRPAEPDSGGDAFTVFWLRS